MRLYKKAEKFSPRDRKVNTRYRKEFINNGIFFAYFKKISALCLKKIASLPLRHLRKIHLRKSARNHKSHILQAAPTALCLNSGRFL